MPPSGSSVGDEQGIAERLAEGQRAISIAEFFEKNKHMLGFDSEARALVTAVKEAVDNAFDAAEEAGILPDVLVDIQENGDYYTLIVEDNGPGITKEQVPKIFGKMLYGSRFHKREQSLPPGQQVLLDRDGRIETLGIGEFCDAYLPPAGNATVPIDENVRAPVFNHDTLEVSWEPVTHAIRHETTETVYRITTERGRTMEVTGNHSLFTLDGSGTPIELKAADLDPGELVLAPSQIPQSTERVTSINLLDHIPFDELDGRGIYVYGIDEDLLRRIETGEVHRKKPNPDSPRRRYYYQYNGVDILRDSYRQYLENGFLPASTVIRLGWVEEVADCELRTYQVGGKQTSVSVSLPVNESFVDLLGFYISEGHACDRQLGFNFGAHEEELIEATEAAVASVGGNTTTVARERNSVRVKAFGSPLAMALKTMCGDRAQEKRIPEFVFHIDPDLQTRFIRALYLGDGSDAHPQNEIVHSTTSETLSRQLSILWNMQGVVASTAVKENAGGYVDDTTVYHTKVFGADINVLEDYTEVGNTKGPRYNRVPTDLLSGVQINEVAARTVPDSIPGLIMGTGIGSSLSHAERYQEVIESAIEGDLPDVPYYTHNLQQYGLLDENQEPTELLRRLWSKINDLQGLTDGDVCLLTVKNVEEIDAPQYVYDISVPGETGVDENFVVCNDGALFAKNSRGQQGIGISAAVLYAQLTSGKAARITSRPMGSDTARYFEVIIDTDENEPEIKAERDTQWDRAHGTRIELELEANLRARQRLHDYIKQTAIVNPHARIELREPRLSEPKKFERATDQLPAETKEIRPHPHGVELGTLIKMLETTDSYSISGFLQGEFTRVGKKSAADIIASFRDHHFGRELTWTPPGAIEGADLEGALIDAVTRKGKGPTQTFADYVTDAVNNLDRVSNQDITQFVHDAADRVEDETDRRFGATVRSNAIEAAWAVITGEDDGDRLASDLYRIIDEVTTSRKDDRTKHGLAERIVDRVRAADRPRHRFTNREIEELIESAADATEQYADATIGETARANIIDALWTRMRRVEDDPPSVREVARERDLAAALLEGMRTVDVMAPPTDCLAPITAELIEEGLRKEFNAELVAATTRDASVHGGDPFVVEAGVAYGGDLEEDSQIDLMRFANRVPLVYQRGACATTDVVRQIDWRNYNLNQTGGTGMPHGAMALVVHVASTNVPFTSESKDAIANIPAIEHEAELAIREVARSVKRHISQRQSLRKRREKEDVIARVLPEIATKISAVVDRPRPDIDATLARIMNNVHVSRVVETDNGEMRVTLGIKNYDSNIADLEVTDIVDSEPLEVGDDVTVVEMDDAWYVRWKPRIDAGESDEIAYTLADGTTSNLAVSGLPEEKLTIDQQ